MYGCDILCGISKGTFEIPHKISCPYIQRCLFYADVKILELLDLRDFDRFWNCPLVPPVAVLSHTWSVYRGWSQRPVSGKPHAARAAYWPP